ncbi:MAG: hypothetical protein MET45_25145 [Nostoc sp. LLA-1]|nr:hypothetical protein [Cyanocohniella sp. LLY]
MNSTFNWNPEKTLWKKVIHLASERGQSPESIISEAVKLYVDTQLVETVNNVVSNGSIPLF